MNLDFDALTGVVEQKSAEHQQFVELQKQIMDFHQKLVDIIPSELAAGKPQIASLELIGEDGRIIPYAQLHVTITANSDNDTTIITFQIADNNYQSNVQTLTFANDNYTNMTCRFVLDATGQKTKATKRSITLMKAVIHMQQTIIDAITKAL